MMLSLLEDHVVISEPGARSRPAVPIVPIEAAEGEPAFLVQVRDALLLDARAAGMLSRCLRTMWFDVDACMALTIDDYEMAKQRDALRRYLERAGFDRRRLAGEIAAARKQGVSDEPFEDPVCGLVQLMLGDRQADAVMRRLSTNAEDGSLAELLASIVAHRQRRIRRVAHLVIRKMAGDDEGSRAVRGCLTTLWGES